MSESEYKSPGDLKPGFYYVTIASSGEQTVGYLHARSQYRGPFWNVVGDECDMDHGDWVTVGDYLNPQPGEQK